MLEMSDNEVRGKFSWLVIALDKVLKDVKELPLN
jgi:hypothetical protein